MPRAAPRRRRDKPGRNAAGGGGSHGGRHTQGKGDPPMADESQSSGTIRSINWREVFPFLHIFRAFRVAVHPSKLVLGLLALLTLYAGGRILDGIWPTNSLALRGEAA